MTRKKMETKNMRRAKEIVESRLQSVNESEIRDASPYFQNFADSVGNASSAIGGAYGEISGLLQSARQAITAITSATNAAHAIGDNSNAIIDNISAVQSADPSQSIITLSDHRSGVQQAYNILASIQSCLSTANGLCSKLNQLAARQFI